MLNDLPIIANAIRDITGYFSYLCPVFSAATIIPAIAVCRMPSIREVLTKERKKDITMCMT
jgi:hypothetical protein